MTGGLKVSTHADQRLQHRGFRQQDLGLVLAWGTPLDDGGVILLREKDVDEARRHHEPEIERLRGLCGRVVVVRGNGVVTCYRPSEKRAKRMLRRARHGPHRRRSGSRRRRLAAR